MALRGRVHEGMLSHRGCAVRFCLIDDNQMVTDALSLALRDLGHSVEVAHDGASGVALAASGAHDAVVIDMRLPGMDGAAVVAALRQAGASAALIAASGHDLTGAAQRELGADEFLQKPFTPRALIAVAERLVAARA